MSERDIHRIFRSVTHHDSSRIVLGPKVYESVSMNTGRRFGEKTGEDASKDTSLTTQFFERSTIGRWGSWGGTAPGYGMSMFSLDGTDPDSGATHIHGDEFIEN